MASKKFLVNINLNGNVVENFQVQGLAAAPTKVANGGLYYNTDDKKLYIGVADKWVAVPTSASELSGLQTAITNAINAVTVSGGSHVKITNSKDGKTFTITESDIASANELNTLNTTVNGVAATGGSNVKSWIADAVVNAKETIDAYKVNGKAISSSPVLTGDDIKQSTTDGALTLNAAIADAKKAGTDAQTTANAKVASVSGSTYVTVTTGTTPTVSAKTGKVSDNTDALATAKDVKSYVDDAVKTNVASVYKVKGSCAYADLATKTDAVEGDVWNVTDANDNVPAGTNYVWVAKNGDTAAHWDPLGGSIDLSPYAKTTDVNSKISAETTRATAAEQKAQSAAETAQSTANAKVASVKSGDANTITVGGTATAPTVSAKTSTVSSNGSGLTTAKDVKSYVDTTVANAVKTSNGIAHHFSKTITTTANTATTINQSEHKCSATPIVSCYEGGALVEVDVAIDASGNVSITTNQAASLTVVIVG